MWLRHHNNRFWVKTYIDFYKLKVLPKEVCNYQKLKGCLDMLISPRGNVNEYRYSCCAACKKSMYKTLSIDNGCVNGKFPKLTYTNDNSKVCKFNVESDLVDVMRALLVHTQPHGYVMVFVGGKHKSIMRHCHFFQNGSNKSWRSNQSHSPQWKMSACVLHAFWKNECAAYNNFKKEMCSEYKFICYIINMVYQKIRPQGNCRSSNPIIMSTASY